MQRLSNRIVKLESSNGQGDVRVTCSKVTFVSPNLEKRRGAPNYLIQITGGDMFSMKDHSSEAEMLAAAGECHRRIYGRPLPASVLEGKTHDN